jgi:pyruvate,orthophosphate dikinase
MLCFTDASVHAHLVGTGIGIGGGAVNGIIAFDLEDIKYLTDKYPYEKIILIRPDTVPDDIEMIFECDALLTARGGATSHAAVTAVQLGKICIVNCKQLMVVEGEKKCRINCVEFHSGDKISIDASLGNIYSGHHPVSLERIDYLNGNKI